jgi:hypothetical protein
MNHWTRSLDFASVRACCVSPWAAFFLIGRVREKPAHLFGRESNEIS